MQTSIVMDFTSYITYVNTICSIVFSTLQFKALWGTGIELNMSTSWKIHCIFQYSTTLIFDVWLHLDFRYTAVNFCNCIPNFVILSHCCPCVPPMFISNIINMIKVQILSFNSTNFYFILIYSHLIVYMFLICYTYIGWPWAFLTS